MNNMKNLWFFIVLLVAVEGELLGQTDKLFGVGHGPVFLGGSEAGQQRTDLAFEAYNEFINYKRRTGDWTLEEAENYHRWTSMDYCIGACPRNSYCKDGLCVCDHEESIVQLYGQCYGNDALHLVGDDAKYRKPVPPPLPEWCYCPARCGGREVCHRFRDEPECKTIVYPNLFEHNSQFCMSGDHTHCMTKDINMICGDKTMLDMRDGLEKNVCECRQGMQFDTKSMECRIFIFTDVDCKDYETKTPEWTDKDYTQIEATKIFCHEMDSVARKYADAWNPNNVSVYSSPVLAPEDSIILMINVARSQVLIAMGYCPDTQFAELWKDFFKFCFPNLYYYYHEFLEYQRWGYPTNWGYPMLRDPQDFLYGLREDFDDYLFEERHWWDHLVSDVGFVFADFRGVWDMISTMRECILYRCDW